MGMAIAVVGWALIGGVCAYRRTTLRTWLLLSWAWWAVCWGTNQLALIPFVTTLGFWAVVTVGIGIPKVRQQILSKPLMGVYRKMLPPLSQTERIALESGSVGFEGQLFSGKPDWEQLLAQPPAQLTTEEQAFLDGPVEQLCAMTDDWDITHVRADLPPEMWAFMKEHKFFGMIIPKEYGGLGFSALAHHQVIQKLASISTVVSSTVGVPNSLGPGELLMHYGTAEQKTHYLPRLADGREIPCFGLTGPFAGSDATSIPDYGIVTEGDWQGERVLGVSLTFDKRYITLAPVATLIGLAFRMYDPDGKLGKGKDIGITLALLPRETAGVEVGRRHFPLNSPFQNGPVRGQQVFLPLSQLIGGSERAGQGWQMLNECLSIGRSITLPSTASGTSKIGAVTTGAYARIRKQFGLSVGRFEGVEEALARIGGKAYAISALAQATALAVDRGEKPAVPSAIAKYHCTSMGREVSTDIMDVLGGKGIILGPKNFAGRNWQAAPIGITVEGANIMTRSLLIFGQGAILCHPWVMHEMKAVNVDEMELESPAQRQARLAAFDHAVFGHFGYGISNAVRALWLGLCGARWGKAPGNDYTRRYFRKLNRYSAALALMADVSMLTLGGKLKFKESLSGRLGDVLSQLYLSGAMLKRFHDEGAPTAEEPVLAWAFHDSIHQIETALSAALRNFPTRPIGWLLWALIFPWGRRAEAPSDRLGHKVASLLMSPNPVQDRLMKGTYTTPTAHNPAGQILASLIPVMGVEPIERKFLKALKADRDAPWSPAEQWDKAVAQGWITAEEKMRLEALRQLTLEVIGVDDFSPEELRAGEPSSASPLDSSEQKRLSDEPFPENAQADRS